MPPTTNQAVFLSLFLSSAAACTDGSFRDGEQVGEPGLDRADVPVALQELPKVQRFSVASRPGATAGMAFVAGDLGQELGPVMNSFGMNSSELHKVQSAQDSLGVTVERYQQRRNGLRVVGGDLRITRSLNNKILSATATSWEDAAMPSQAAISSSQAGEFARAGIAGAESVSDGELVYISPSDGGATVLAWQHTVSGVHKSGMPLVDHVFVNALSGDIVDRHAQVHSARNRSTYDSGATETAGTLVRSELSPPSGTLAVDSAHDAAGAAYDCFAQLFNRDSYDGLGAELVSVANYGVDYRNAFWHGQLNVMVYGLGFEQPDIGTHEIAHAVTTSTANMVYQNEPGALNEAWSDIFSAICDVHATGVVSDTTWLLGETLPNGAIRLMSDPTKDGISTDYYPTRYVIVGEPNEDNDRGGVHINSGIANLAFYLLSQGGVHPRGVTTVPVGPLGIEAAGQIFYRALTTYMNTNTDFAGARVATEQAAVDLFGAGSAQSISVSEAWAAVGVGGAAPVRSEPAPAPPEQNENTPGSEPGEAAGDGNNVSAQNNGDVVGGCSATGGNQSQLPLTFLLLFAGLFLKRTREE